ncbi:bifunctional 4-hydroxy-2-oxoglutarate aldolase/2-dehydro-3-deoxy-phosphogluconate aldolase [Aliifodinibius sp. S!AR15-10]|uniref:bifunctional 4-hydroxy-2-oxoglutarate aldolase/2-dehydro-3-deoxy-phosphogluconate aldolase n=1 Tax=Aliifodinibius sp. S!AR15-10 TaxID=2950437 RepID=UPI002856D713|nr:bifunctional 4-hydroxy-2-oxoglutarate aldolase/2-dehydro-3-deoxy-phosphogluconate aldolase [Aliifodinibius sp. S!AR15-10]MDR8394606.1 bifunctional 4-hydroxy-2-oxoglutarate aldolase/2-dehydro-3-deoxy-phosphogluconate aldolase [Aliifodinibius sp. S!AR15-10]
MARFSRIEVATTMRKKGVVPLFYHDDLELSKKVLTACYKGGARLLEFTNRGDFAHEIFGELNKFARKELPEMIMGVGSVPDGGTASMYMQLGADFIVSAMLKEDIARVCNRRKVLWAPGCGTLTEINRAEELGAEIVKIFPGSQLGPGFIKAVTAPNPWTSLMPTGGVKATKENLSGWFNAGAVCVGMGSDLITKEHLANEDFKGLEQHVRETIELVESVRK